MATLAQNRSEDLGSVPTVNYGSYPNYIELADRAKDFLQHFKSSESIEAAKDVNDDVYDHRVDDILLSQQECDPENGPKYMYLLQKIANRELTTIIIELDDIKRYEEITYVRGSEKASLAETIAKNSNHFIELFSKAIDELLPEPTVDITQNDSVLDVIIHQRKLRNARLLEDQRQEDQATELDPNQNDDENDEEHRTAELFPAQLLRRYCLYFKPQTNATLKTPMKTLAVRGVKGSHLGKLITVRGIIIRVSDVKPAVEVNAYTCDTCGYEIFQEVKSKTFMPMFQCTSQQCTRNKHAGRLFPSTRASKFSPYQDVKIQELANQVPTGHIPRMLTIHINGDLVRSVNPGDIVDVSGIFLPAPYTGFKALRAGLLTETYLEAQFIKQHKRKYETLGLTNEIKEKIEEIRSQDRCYEILASSIAPEIYGHLDVKKALLLLLVGGVTKEMGDGMRIRGDINILLMGDPGVAKSQLLKSISKIAPRGVYTTGKGSSGVGLTAAVMRDPITDELVLEGGALVLADNGICCIDEFDKMEESDRTAIHEVMEQQTISISKAGITTTLNARASILAAANPLYGRYNTKLSPNENINLPAALLSRFDILFLILDKPSVRDDIRLAEHVAYVHMHNKHPTVEGLQTIDGQTMRQYISCARQYRPVITKEVSDYVVSKYIKLRQESKRNENSRKHFSHASPRTLLGILRMSQALARIRFSNDVLLEDVDEALRLVDAAKRSLLDEDEELQESSESRIFTLIKDIIEQETKLTKSKLIKIESLRNACLGKSYTENMFIDCIKKYQDLNVWQLVDNDEYLTLIDPSRAEEDDNGEVEAANPFDSDVEMD